MIVVGARYHAERSFGWRRVICAVHAVQATPRGVTNTLHYRDTRRRLPAYGAAEFPQTLLRHVQYFCVTVRCERQSLE